MDFALKVSDENHGFVMEVRGNIRKSDRAAPNTVAKKPDPRSKTMPQAKMPGSRRNSPVNPANRYVPY